MDIPNYVVMNQYQAPHVCIGEHHDAAELFDAVSRPAVILSFNVQSDGILYFKLQHDGPVAKKLAQITQCNRHTDIRNWGYCHPVFVPAKHRCGDGWLVPGCAFARHCEPLRDHQVPNL